MTEPFGRNWRGDWFARVDGIRQWSRHGERAPHKPLLLLYALSRLQNDNTSRASYEIFHRNMLNLLENFGPTRNVHHPEFPFVRLANDGLWELTFPAGADSITNVEQPSSKQLIAARAVGRLRSVDEQQLLRDPSTIHATIRRLLAANWPQSLHADICAALGLTPNESDRSTKRRVGQPAASSDRFRQRVLRAYEYRCAMCRWDARIDDKQAVGLDAAELHWRALGGSSETDNGLSLCTRDHKLFDLGLLSLTDDLRIAVSRRLVVRGPAAEAVLGLSAERVVSTQDPTDSPSRANIGWHRKAVFKAPARCQQ